jgi:diketogulonate reductase-like aldo/keto reductase
MPKFALADLVALPNTLVKMPRLGFGVYQSPPETCLQSVQTALKAGYRHIDTAQYYANEREVGEAVRRSGIPREEVFVTTKILRTTDNIEAAYESVSGSVEKIGLGYVDLFLIHSPGRRAGARKSTWLALERLVEEGKAKSIGVSNYGVGHIEEMRAYAKIWPPHVNQIEVLTTLFI